MTRRDRRHQSRRSFLRSGGAFAASLATPWLSHGAHAQAHEGSVVFAFPGGSTQSLFQKFIIPEFTRQTGIAIEYVASSPADTVGRLRAQRGSSGIDVCQLAGIAAYQAIDNGLLESIDESLVPNSAHIDPNIPRDPQIMPFSVSGNCLVYQKKVFDAHGWEAPSSWFDLWDPRFAGHTGMYGMNVVGGLAMLLQIAKELTGDYTNLEPAYAKFRELRRTIYEFFTSPGAWETAMQQEDLWLAVNSTTRGMQLSKEGAPIGVVLPQSGVPYNQVSVGLARDAPHPKAAHMWVNHLLDKDVQKLFVKYIGYNPSVLGVEISPEDARFFPRPGQAWFPDWHKISANFDKIVDRWQREVER